MHSIGDPPLVHASVEAREQPRIGADRHGAGCARGEFHALEAEQPHASLNFKIEKFRVNHSAACALLRPLPGGSPPRPGRFAEIGTGTGTNLIDEKKDLWFQNLT
jgi:hypothetical protein